MGTVYPMLILIFTLLFIFLENRHHDVTQVDLSKAIFFYALLLFAIFTAVSLFLNVLVIKSILTPIREMLARVNEIRKGDYGRRIEVISNDELGILGDAGNDMIQGLVEREKIRETFGKYVTPEIRDQILADRIPLNGEIKTATLLFSDIRNFTRYVEENDPEEAIQGMRNYFTAMQNAIRSNTGLVLQYVGDEIEAVFGVPLEDDRQADHAVLAALEMRKRLNELNHDREEMGKPAFHHGIGIFTGSVLAGNTGSEDRLSYALIGNTVNLASRIQELTKSFKCDILVSEETVKNLHNRYPLKQEPPQKVKGYSKPVLVFRVL
jgi:class 3 adenylate cyclase